MPDQIADNVIVMIKKKAAANGTESSPTENKITTATELASLGLDSLDLTELLWDLEETYGIGIELNTTEAWANLQTVGDLVEAVRALIAKEV
ncbi:acyl carrier protein [Rhizobium calliandrae]|uniref:Acyl carrier protein n=3 Tax=Rhizobium TaxID=379 RepID=A0A387G2G8_9HYPH|nr:MULTISPECIES: acyl carrier protein [Rhizobium]AYG63997.1 acyl carrier protein [Rhizobium jaguaris]MDL2402946.1 acyl carrier protein [Rhizobium mayense]MDL2408250.1 acyl carrier protein [Rhizobium calliandrae]